MSAVLIVAAIIAALIFIPKLFTNPETKLFRRVWSAEKFGGVHGHGAKLAAVRALTVQYGVNFDGNLQATRQSIGNLLSAATEFDFRHRNNLGVQVMPVIARSLLAEKGTRQPELNDDLTQMMNVDGVALMNSLSKDHA